MAIIKEFEIIRKKVSDHILKKNQLDADLEKSRKETAQTKTQLTDAKGEIDTLSAQKKELIQEKANFQEAIKQFKELGEKNKKEMDKMEKKIEEMTGEIEALKDNEDEGG